MRASALGRSHLAATAAAWQARARSSPAEHALGLAVGPSGVSGGSREQRECLERRTGDSADGGDIANLAAHESLDRRPDDPVTGEEKGRPRKAVERHLDSP